MKCVYIKANGEPCEANAVGNSSYCFSHSPEYRKEKALAVQKGGLNRKLIQVYGDEVEIRTPQDIKNLLADSINLVWTGKMPANQPANSIAYLCRCWLDAHEVTEITLRLDAIEKKLTEVNL
jgi:hypothetical protein